jgi:hypothetical protein
MERRTGDFAMYQRREFGLAVFDQRKLELISYEPNNQKNSFRKYADGVFTTMLCLISNDYQIREMATDEDC